MALRPEVLALPGRHPQGWGQRPQHLAGRLLLLGIATFPWDYRQKRAVDGIRVHFDSPPGGSVITSTWAGPPPTRRALVRPLPHLLGRLHQHERSTQRHPGRVHADHRLPRDPGFLPGQRHRPDPQLHGLQLGQLLRGVHRGPGRARTQDVGRLPGLNAATPNELQALP